MELPSHVQLVEVGMRDGLQNESQFIPTPTKQKLISDLTKTGVTKIQVTSFVNPKLVPQLADAEELCGLLESVPGVIYSALVLSQKGLERAHKAGLSHVDLSISASETHSRKNLNRSIAQALDEFRTMVACAKDYGLAVQGGIQCAFGCAYEGKKARAQVLQLVEAYLDVGVNEFLLADSTGMANPLQINQSIQSVQALIGDYPLVLHLHDTWGLGLANVYAALQHGVTRFETAFGGFGGCPFIPGATGNIATEDTLYLLSEMGIKTGIDLDQVIACSARAQELLGKTPPSQVYRLKHSSGGMW